MPQAAPFPPSRLLNDLLISLTLVLYLPKSAPSPRPQLKSRLALLIEKNLDCFSFVLIRFGFPIVCISVLYTPTPGLSAPTFHLASLPVGEFDASSIRSRTLACLNPVLSSDTELDRGYLIVATLGKFSHEIVLKSTFSFVKACFGTTYNCATRGKLSDVIFVKSTFGFSNSPCIGGMIDATLGRFLVDGRSL